MPPDLTKTATSIAARAVLGSRNPDVNVKGSNSSMNDKEVRTWANHTVQPGGIRRGGDYGVAREARKEQ